MARRPPTSKQRLVLKAGRGVRSVYVCQPSDLDIDDSNKS